MNFTMYFIVTLLVLLKEMDAHVIFEEPLGRFDENHNILEGDILMSDDPAVRQAIHPSHNGDPTCTRWPDAKVLYNRESSMSQSVFNKVQQAMALWSKYTCVTFQSVSSGTPKPYCKFFSSPWGCFFHVGRRCFENGGNYYAINSYCSRTLRTPIHGLGHVIGLYHMQSRSDRDDYVTVHEHNIYPSCLPNVKKLTDETGVNYDVEYDLCSIVHSHNKAYSKNGQVTLEPKDSRYTDQIGTGEGVSFGDIKLVNRMYDCAGHCNDTLSCPGRCFLDKTCSMCYCPHNDTGTCVRYTQDIHPITISPIVPTTPAPPVTPKPVKTTKIKKTKETCHQSRTISGRRPILFTFHSKNRKPCGCDVHIKNLLGRQMTFHILSAKFLPEEDPCTTNYFSVSSTGDCKDEILNNEVFREPYYKLSTKFCGKWPKPGKVTTIKSKADAICFVFHSDGKRRKISIKARITFK